MKTNYIFIALILLLVSCQKSGPQRKVISLNGILEISKTDSLLQIPSDFAAKIPVPGLIDMAIPEIDNQDTAYNSSVYWYRRTFTVENLNADVIRLKINKSSYHTWVYVNGKPAGENVYSFTPSEFNIKPLLNKGNKENELIIAVGCRNSLPDTVTNGGDFEKIKYIPGIYDDVKLTTSGFPFINNIQIIPDIKNMHLRIVAEIVTDGSGKLKDASYKVRESVSGKVITEGSVKFNQADETSLRKIDFGVKMEGCQLWSPENPFLYDLELKTTGDNKITRFGMRSFAASRDSSVFLLNDKPYYMRGTNVCIFRFFEDPDRNGLPWDSKWVTKLHNRFKEMHWNSIRYCIGFPPERWYEIADSLGFLIQDEYPIWTGGKGGFSRLLGGINSRQLSAEYLEWMRERWNHPCVVVWDAQNESVNDTTARAISLVREFDLSARPWDNGWAAPQSSADAIESHPYLFSRYMKKKPEKDGYLKELFAKPLIPGNDPNSHSPAIDGKPYLNPVILNEYGWIWLNRNGSPTTLTDNVYKNVFPEANTPEKRLETYAKNLAILTEFWRVNRKAAAVMHFCGLGYSRSERPRGQTSDNFTDLINLVYEPNFLKYVKQAFSPVAVMAEFWDNSLKGGQEIIVPLHVINDTYETVEDSVSLSIFRGNDIIFKRSLPYKMEGLQKKIVSMPVSTPNISGDCRMEAVINFKGEPVKSIREFKIFSR